MGKLTVVTLQVIIAIALVGSIIVQVVIVPLMWADLDDAPGQVRLSFTIAIVLGIVTLQVSAVCIWRLLTMVRRGSVFSRAAFRYVDVVIGAIAAASLILVGLGVALAPGEAVAPGVVLLIGGAALVVAGVALVVLVLRMLLAQAVARETEALRLRSELEEVI
jgi:hypothetical protein